MNRRWRVYLASPIILLAGVPLAIFIAVLTLLVVDASPSQAELYRRLAVLEARVDVLEETAGADAAAESAARHLDSPDQLARRRETAEATAYCLTGEMANGQRVFDGAAASNRYELGTRLHVVELGVVVTITDRHKPGVTDLDIAMPGRCAEANEFGRKNLTVEILESTGGG